MISHAAKCIFIHQKKAAGTSIKQIFADFVPGRPEGSYLSDGILDPAWSIAPEVSRYLKFTVVRNPWDRFISGWLYCRRTRRRSIAEVLRNLPRETISLKNVVSSEASWSARKSFFSEYLSRSGRNMKRILEGSPREKRDWFGHDYIHLVRQQHETIVRADGSLVVDRILFVEELEAGLRDLEKTLGFPLAKLPNSNANSVRRDYRGYFDSEARELFDRIFAKDIELFGYDFETGLRTRTWPWENATAGSHFEVSLGGLR